MNRRPPKTEEPKAAYAAKKPAKATGLPKMAGDNDKEFKRIADKLFIERKELLHKLAQ